MVLEKKKNKYINCISQEEDNYLMWEKFLNYLGVK